MLKEDVENYLDIAKRRKYWIIIPFLVTILGGLAYALTVPKIYEAKTLILVEEQSVPKDLVRPIVAEGIDERLRTIAQQVTSRTNIEAIIRECRLSGDAGSSSGIDELVTAVRKEINIDVSRGGGGRSSISAFTISYHGKDPKKVMQVTNALAANFISQNLEIRESQVLGTSSFLAGELESVGKRLTEKEEELKAYRERYMGGLPDQLNANLAMLQRLQSKQDQLSKNLADAENRKILIQQTVDEVRKGRQTLISPSAEGSGMKDLPALRNELATLEARYTSQHPDVIRLKKQIETMEASEAKPGTASSIKTTGPTTTEQALMQQVRDIDLEITSTKEEMKKAQAEMNAYQKRVEDTPKREQELFSIQRDYQNLKGNYDSLLKRKLEADISASMEKKQKGEQFRVLDPAKIPTQPVQPDVRKILLMVLAAGLGLGGGLAYFVEMMDSSFRNADDLEKELKVPVLVSIPFRYTKKEISKRRRNEIVKAASVAVGFAVCVFAILLVTKAKGLENPLEYMKSLI
jgi:polysaccharide chain length determinant protein (PEP-CTERM system associated)